MSVNHFFPSIGIIQTAAVKMTLKCTVVVVGDALVGKSALIKRLINNEFTEVRPISFPNITHNAPIIEEC